MNKRTNPRMGIMFRREHAPEKLPDFARRAEDAGFDELWVVEDCFYGSGIASAAAALSVTSTITVGLGIMPAVARNPVFTAMEIATIARMFPGRFLPGLGHGMAHWMRQIGAFPKSQLNALEEVTIAVKRLLSGERLSYDGRHMQLDRAELVHPPDRIPSILLGVRGPKSLTLSGRVADGTILAEYASPAYVSWAREQIADGQRQAGRDSDHQLTVFAMACAGESAADARQQLRPLVSSAIVSGKVDMQLAPMGILPKLQAMRQSLEGQELLSAVPDSWIEQLTISGTPADWHASLAGLAAAGADSVVLVPIAEKGVEELARFAEHAFGEHQ